MISVQWEWEGGWWALFARHDGNVSWPTTYGFDAKPSASAPEKPAIERFNSAVRAQVATASNGMWNQNWYGINATIGNSCDNSSCYLEYTVTNVTTSTQFPTLTYNDTTASRLMRPGIVALSLIHI